VLNQFGSVEARHEPQFFLCSPSRVIHTPNLYPFRIASACVRADPQFKADVSKSNIRIDPLDSETLAQTIAGVLAMPADTVAKARTFYGQLLTDHLR